MRFGLHHFVSAADIKPTLAFPDNSQGYRRFALSDRSVGAVHTGWGMCELDAGGHLDTHVQSFEKSFFVLEGRPVLILEGRGYRLEPGACGLIPVGMQHSWLGPEEGTARWTDMNAPCPKGENFSDDTYFLGVPTQVQIKDLDIRDPGNRHIFKMSDDDIKVDSLRVGLKKDAPKVSASMATALLVYSDIALKMLVAKRLAVVKLVGYTEAIHTLLPKMTDDCSVVLFGGLAKERPYPGSTTVTSVNGAVTSMIRTFATEMAPIRFNAIHPGIISDSPAWENNNAAIKATEARTPGGILATTTDVVGSVDFMLSNQGVNGVNLFVDRGWVLT